MKFSNLDQRNLIIDSGHGTHVPQMFALEYKHLLEAAYVDGDEIAEALLKGPGSEEYWPVWQHVLDTFEHTQMQRKYVLVHDCDLWLVASGRAESWQYT